MEKEKYRALIMQGLLILHFIAKYHVPTSRMLYSIMSVVLHGLENFDVAYLDYITTCSTSEEVHKLHIQKMLIA